MTRQRTDSQVLTDAAKRNEVRRDLVSLMHRNGIRDTHTSRKARAAIARAASPDHSEGEPSLFIDPPKPMKQLSILDGAS